MAVQGDPARGERHPIPDAVGGSLLPTDPAVRSGAAVELFYTNNWLHDF